MSDPLGRRALFSPPTNSAGTTTLTKEALFSASAGDRRSGTVVVECSRCGAHTRLGWAEFVWRHFPFGLWVPWLRYSQHMSCPACDARTWLGVSWFA